MNFSWLVMAISTMLISTTVFAEVNDSAITTKWSYVGNTAPQRWGELNPAFRLCDNGKEQSPINIKKHTAVAANTLNVDYKPARLYLIDDGTTKLLLGQTQTIFNDGQTLQANFAANDAPLVLHYDNTSYRLVQFHIHSPSETLLKGVGSPMELHFVHQGENGKVAVLAVFVKAGEANLELRKIVSNIPPDDNVQHEIQGEKINPLGLLPKKLNYYAYKGSLTTPPCTEGLQWIVLANSITASPAQILKLRNIIGNNARPIQDLNKRVVTFSEVQ